MQRRRLCTALLCALALSACSTSPAPEASAEHDDTADAIAAATAPPPPMEPAATLDSVVVASPAMAKQANVAMRFMGPPSVAKAFAGGYRQDENTEKYEHREDNPVHRASEQPVEWPAFHRHLRMGTTPEVLDGKAAIHCRVQARGRAFDGARRQARGAARS